MASNPEQPDSIDEAQLEHLLQAGYDNVQPNAEFQASLLQQLDQEFVRTHQSMQSPNPQAPNPHAPNPQTEQAVSPAPNGQPAGSRDVDSSMPDATAMPDSRATSTKGPSTDPSIHPPTTTYRRRRIGLRLAMTLATAASMLFAIALWNSQNAYGWASMLRALENCGWVQAVSESAGLSGWVSSRHGIVAIRSAEKVAFHDRTENTSSEYLADRQVVYRQNLSMPRDATEAGQLLGLLWGSGNDALVDQQAWQVVAETWRQLEANDGQSGDIELRVTLRKPGQQPKLYKVLALLDPQTHLPRSVRLLNTDRSTAANLTEPIVFNYPSEGPSSIFSLGVPRGTAVVASLAEGALTQGKAAREAVASRTLGQSKRQTSAEKTTATLKTDNELKITATETAREDPTEKSAAKKTAPETAATETAATETAGRETTSAEAAEIVPIPAIEANELVVRQGDEARPAQVEQPPDTHRLAAQTPRPRHVLPKVSLPEQPLELEALIEQVNAQLVASWQA